jgi:hypothetical protein
MSSRATAIAILCSRNICVVCCARLPSYVERRASSAPSQTRTPPHTNARTHERAHAHRQARARAHTHAHGMHQCVITVDHGADVGQAHRPARRCVDRVPWSECRPPSHARSLTPWPSPSASSRIVRAIALCDRERTRDGPRCVERRWRCTSCSRHARDLRSPPCVAPAAAP